VQTQAMAKQLHFNKNMEALKKLQAGVDKLSSVVGVTLGPKVQSQIILKPSDPEQSPYHGTNGRALIIHLTGYGASGHLQATHS